MGRSAAFFDLDKTIIAKSSVLAFGRPFYREGLLSRRAIVKSMYAQIVYMLVGADESKMEEVREAMLSLTKGWQQDRQSRSGTQRWRSPRASAHRWTWAWQSKEKPSAACLCQRTRRKAKA